MQIPEFTRRKLASSVVGVSEIDTSSSKIADAISKVSQSASNVLFEEQKVLDKSAAAAAYTSMDIASDEVLYNHQQQYADDPLNKTDKYQSSLNELAKQTRETIKSPRAQVLFDEMAAQGNLKKVGQEKSWARDQAATKAFNDITESVNSLAYTAMKAGEMGDESRLQDLLQNVVGTAEQSRGLLAPDQFIKLQNQAPKSVISGYINGISNKNPEEAIRFIEKGGFEKLYTPQEVDNLLDNAVARQEHMDIKGEKALREEQEFATFGFVAKMFSQDGDRPTQADIQEAVESGTISPRSGADLIKAMNSPETTKNDLGELLNLNTKLVTGSLKQEDIINSFTNGKITQSKAEEYVGLVSQNISNNPAIKFAVEDITLAVTTAAGVTSASELYGDYQQNLSDALEELKTGAIGGGITPEDKHKTIPQLAEEIKKRTINKMYYAGLPKIDPALMSIIGDQPTLKSVSEAKSKIALRISGGQLTNEQAVVYLKQLKELEKVLQSFEK